MKLIQAYNSLIQRYRQQNQRSKSVQKNIVGNVVVKGMSIILSLLIIPLTIGYVSEYDYGIWITLSSVIGWLAYFDVGVNNGLRNKLTEAISQGNLVLAKQYVSTTYAILICIFIPILIAFIALSGYVNWYIFFSLEPTLVKSLSSLLIIIVSFVCIRSILSTILIILFAVQKAAMSSLIAFFEQLASFVAIAILVKFTEGNLFNLCFVFCLAPLAILLLSSILLFRGRYRAISPSIKTINWSLKNKLFNMGIKFFIIQIAGIVQFQTTSFIILKFFGALDVTAYNIAFKYFNIIYMCWALTLSPLWNAITEAKAKKDNKWISTCIRHYQRLFILFICGALLMLICSQFFYHIWLGDKIAPIPFKLSLVICIYVITLTWGSLYVQVLNGLGALKIQFVSSIISPLVFLAICYLLITQFHLGVISVVIASILANFNGIILAPYQYHVIIENRKPKSIWSRTE